jgi:hypothetical protein|tara:strand:- start:397 stop:672 length:276 start_codon:yes stop_codon:yes gene_type:complete
LLEAATCNALESEEDVSRASIDTLSFTENWNEVASVGYMQESVLKLMVQLLTLELLLDLGDINIYCSSMALRVLAVESVHDLHLDVDGSIE